MKQIFRLLIISAIVLQPLAVFGNDESCPLNGFTYLKYSNLLCQFNLGTTAYRAGVYELAAAHWKFIVKNKPNENEYLEVWNKSRSTLSFLQYHGMGIEVDRQGAVDTWLDAVKNGEYEARNQLGFAYSDVNYKGYDLVKSLAWFKSLVLITPSRAELNDTERNIYDHAIDEVSRISKLVTAIQIKQANKLAQSYRELE